MRLEQPSSRVEGARRAEILEVAAQLFATSGFVATSLRDVADACGILAGSLYHHFDSKEAIAVELLEIYRAELDLVGETALIRRREATPQGVYDRLSAFGAAIAECALRHKAALQLTQYEPRAGASHRLVAVSHRGSAVVGRAMRTLLDDAYAAGFLKQSIDLWALSEQLCDSMLHVGSALLHRDGDAIGVAEDLCQILFDGFAPCVPSDRCLDRSKAMLAARAVIDRWSSSNTFEVDDRTEFLRSIARVEFARRGYEATTVRDIAAAASMGTGTVYRAVRSKVELLDSIMARFHVQLSIGYKAVVSTDSTAVEKLDALTWINVNALERFDKEFEIQRSWFRHAPPRKSSVSGAIEERGRVLESILRQGRADDEFRLNGVDLVRLAASVRDLLWIPPHVFAAVGKAGAMRHCRATVLRGAASRRYGTS